MKWVSTLELALLGLLRQQPQSGYDLRKTFAATAMRHFSDSPGSIYPALRRLQARKWIAGVETEPGNRRGRQEFHVTPAGKAAFFDALMRPVTRDDVIWRNQELMLRFAFMDGNLPRSKALLFLEDFERALNAYVGELRADFRRLSSKVPLNTGLLAFQSGIEGMEAQLGWARRARVRLAEKAR